MATIWIERPIHPHGHAILAHHQVHCPAPEIGDPTADLSGVDAMIITGTTPINAAFVARAPNLRVVARPGIGIDTINLADCTAAGVLVTNTPDAPSESTAEHAVTLLMAVARKLAQADQGMRTLGWQGRGGLQGIEMRDKTLALVGLGRIGGRVAHIMGQGMGMRVIAWDPFVGADRGAALGVELRPSLDEALAEADAVSLHVPLTVETRGLIGARELALMKPGCILVNCARGPVVDEAALYAALASGHLWGAGLDVFEVEPTPRENPLLSLENVIVTPHIASFTEDGMYGMGVGAAEETLAALEGRQPRWLCNPAAWPGRGASLQR